MTACKRAGIEYGRFKKSGFVLHDARHHTFNTNMRRAGVDRSVIMKITGHSTPEMFERYNTIDDEDIRRGIKRMGYFLESLDQNLDQKAILRNSERMFPHVFQAKYWKLLWRKCMGIEPTQ